MERAAIIDSIEELVGSTPLLRLPLGGSGTVVLAKLEMANPLGSVKDRAALFMLDAAEERGDLVRGSGTVVEATSGNTGIALAALAARRGYRCIVVLPESATPERIGLLRLLGAEVVQVPTEGAYRACVEKAREIKAATPGAWYMCQHDNTDNVRAHYSTTGPEIAAATGGDIDVLVCGVGTGGTLTGVARYLKEHHPGVHVVAVEPESSPLLSRGVAGTHKIPGYNGGFTAETTDRTLIDEVMTVSDEDALRGATGLARTAGLLAGISAGAAMHACSLLAEKPEYTGKTLVTILPDTGERYLSMTVGGAAR
ncbi:MAG TPA: cysteine synthase family protein [Amycolatopsis sp.]|uniref:PLP-dependent cysteine synthase family protein n=1 Tax=Amycolatopsis sp. TaxID=37632 RepID=UPI002B471CD5|nr:cysteine synthase family protein [Amycolatopsis sp.]HKS48445.1 cysteine synthase family protein [Amycolatopsis sp.]